jgi:2-methylcitrate dehydratase PrpD
VKQAVEFVDTLRFEDLDARTVQSAKNCLMDFTGAVLGGARFKAARIAKRCQTNSGDLARSTLWFSGAMASAQEATFWNGTVGTALDIDDGHRMAVGHPGSVVIPAAFAVAERIGCSGRRLIEAIVCGYEVAIRSGNIHRLETSKFAATPGTGRWGSLGAAAAVAKLSGLGPSQIEQALAVAATFTPMAPVIDDLRYGHMPMTKYCSAWGGLVGLCAALLAAEGFTGIRSVIHFSESELPAFGKAYEINNVYFKPYPCCRWTHPVLEGCIQLMRRHEELRPGNIKRILVKTFQAASHLAEPHPRTMESAQYSIPFLLGMAMVDGDILPDQTAEERLDDKDILAIADRVEIVYSAELEKYFPRNIPTEIEIESIEGGRYQNKVITPKGDAVNPMPESEFRDKFRLLAGKCLSREAVEALMAEIDVLDRAEEIRSPAGFLDE